jgi:hypothetical protein
MTAELEPRPSLEAQVLVRLGYGHCLDMPLGEGSPLVGRQFLDTYSDPVKRQHTEDTLTAFIDTPESDPDFAELRDALMPYMQAYFGQPAES